MASSRNDILCLARVTGWALGTACFGLLAALPGHGARADVVAAQWIDQTHFDYQINFMPDLDQKRSGLPGNGSQYCVPTSSMNMLAYAAEWGLDELPPGPGVYTLDVGFGTMTNHIDDLGDLMSTGSGTGNDGFYDGMGDWLNGYPLIHGVWYRTEEWAPKAHDLALIATTGALVSFAYGRFDWEPGFQGVPVIGDYTGGHAVTLMYAHQDGPSDLTLWSRDPADDNPVIHNTQSPWSYRIYDTVDTTDLQVDWNNDGLLSYVQGTVLEFDPLDDTIRVIDRFYSLHPAFGFSFDTVQLNVANIGGFDFTVKPPNTQFEPPASEIFIDAAIHPDLTGYFVITESTTTANRWVKLGTVVDLIEGEYQTIMELPLASSLVVGRNRDLYVASGFLLRRLSEENGTWIELDSHAWPPTWNFQDLAYNDNKDELVGLSVSDKKLVVLPPNLGSEVDPVFVYEVPSFIPFADEACMAINPADNSIWFTLPGIDSGFVRRLQISGPELLHTTFSHPLIVNPTCVDFDDRGHMLVVLADGSVRDFEPNSQGGWTAVKGGWYFDLQVGPNFKVARSRTNYDPEIHGQTDQFIPAEELPEIGTPGFDCPGDFDGDLLVGAADLAQLLALWGPCPAPCPADLDGDGSVGPVDLATTLARWGSCLPIDPV
jgi:hypothetical protein